MCTHKYEGSWKAVWTKESDLWRGTGGQYMRWRVSQPWILRRSLPHSSSVESAALHRVSSGAALRVSGTWQSYCCLGDGQWEMSVLYAASWENIRWFIQQRFIELLKCARHCSRYRDTAANEEDENPTLVACSGGRQNKCQQINWYFR